MYLQHRHKPFHHYGTTMYRLHSVVALNSVHFSHCELGIQFSIRHCTWLLHLLSSSILSSLFLNLTDDKPFIPQDVAQSGFIQCLLMTRPGACVFGRNSTDLLFLLCYYTVPHTAYLSILGVEAPNVTWPTPDDNLDHLVRSLSASFFHSRGPITFCGLITFYIRYLQSKQYPVLPCFLTCLLQSRLIILP